MEYTCYYASPLGRITLTSDGKALSGLWFDGQRCEDSFRKEQEEFSGGTARWQKELPIFGMTEEWLDVYFGGGVPNFTPPLVMNGTPFCKAAWEAMLKIPYGKTAAYKEIANLIAAQGGFERVSARSVGGAAKRNAISLIIPCHRIIGANGKLTGYAGGLDKKAWLLKMEHLNLNRLQ